MSLKVENSIGLRGQKIHVRSGNRVLILEVHRSVWRDGIHRKIICFGF